uniref:AsIV-cont00063-ORF2 n=1 Tax=Apophua simplicipes ichnovirus TaxID=1329648 RepID=S5DT20_9VIRU|nr:AsIV-cont00063-ORF2 [Apophua simplicipes ichnovirus]
MSLQGIFRCRFFFLFASSLDAMVRYVSVRLGLSIPEILKESRTSVSYSINRVLWSRVRLSGTRETVQSLLKKKQHVSIFVLVGVTSFTIRRNWWHLRGTNSS